METHSKTEFRAGKQAGTQQFSSETSSSSATSYSETTSSSSTEPDQTTSSSSTSSSLLHQDYIFRGSKQSLGDQEPEIHEYHTTNGQDNKHNQDRKKQHEAMSKSQKQQSTGVPIGRRLSHNEPGGSSSSSTNTKRYRNSPFGLKNHFLTMPDEVATTEHSSNANSRQAGQHVDIVGDDCISSSELSEAAVNWQGYKRHLQKHPRKSTNSHMINNSGNGNADGRNQITSQPISSRRMNVELSCDDSQLAISDAGLDADKCNAKQRAMDSFVGATTHDDLNTSAYINHVNNHKLTMDCNPSNPAANLSNLNQLMNHHQQLKSAHQIKGSSESGSLLIRFSSIMYATFLVILGCIFHISELRQKSKNSHDHIYTIIVAAVGIIWLLFLQIDLLRYKRFASRYILIGSMFNDTHTSALRRFDARHNNQMGSPLGNRSASNSSSAASLVHDRLSLNTEVIFKKTAYKMYEQQQQAAMGKESHLQRLANELNHHRTRAKSISDSPISEINPSSNSAFWLDNQQANIDESQSSTLNPVEPAYKFLHGKMGANFYLKCGMAAFCFGHVIHEGLRFGQQVYFFGTANAHCRDSAALVAHLVTPLYSFYQLFMMFKYSNLVINRHKALAKFGLMHIIGTSVAFWFRTIMEEAFEDFVHKMDYFKANKPELNLLLTARDQQANATNTILTLMSSPISDSITPNLIRHLPDSYACAQNTLLTTKSMNALPYLYPFTIEYNLLLASTFLSLYFNIGKVGHKGNGAGSCSYVPDCSSNSINGHHKHSQHNDNSSSVTKAIDHANDKELGEYKSNFVVNADCHSANKGLFCGFFVLLVTLVTIVIFFVTINKPSHVQLGIKINLIQEATLTILILLVSVVGFKQMKKLNRNRYLKEKVTTDDVLMLIPLPFFFIHSLLSFRAETASLISSSTTSTSSSGLLHNRPTTIAIDLANNRIISQDNGDMAMAATGFIGVNNGTLLNGLFQDYFISSSRSNCSSSSNNFGNNNNDIDNPNDNNNSNNNNNIGNRFSNSSNNHSIIHSKTIEPGGFNSTRRINSQRNNGINIGNIENFATTASSNSGSSSSGSSSSSSSSSNISISNRRRIRRSNGDSAIRVNRKVDVNIGGSNPSSDNNNGNSSFNFSQIDHFKLITVALNIIVMIEVLVQTNFIIDGMRRCSESRYLRFKKPGRELITFAILLNITYWIVATFETKSIEQYKTEIEYYGPLPYMFISHTTLPVMLFYRYHSSVCLTEIWNRAYKLPKEL